MSLQQQRRKPSSIVAVMLTGLMLSACGGGGGSSSPQPTAVNQTTNTGTTQTGNTNNSGFVAGVFQFSSVFKDSCGAPRTSTASETFPDMQGSFADEGYWLRSWSNDTYLWYDEIQDRDPGLYATSAAGVAEYFELLKTEATTPSGNPKDRFHFTRDTAEYLAESQQGITFGYGATYKLISSSAPRELVIVLVNDNSPAADAGLQRGARIVTVDGVDLINGSDADTLNAGLWPNQVNEDHSFEVLDPGATERRAITMTSAQIDTDAVPQTRIIDTDSGKVGYLLFTDHILTAEQQLVDAVTQMRGANITDLVLDLRYNRGGYLYLANQVSYMIAGAGVSGQTFNSLQFNEKNPGVNPVTGGAVSADAFLTTTTENAAPAGAALPTLALPQPRVFVLTTSSTCSASEAIINGLRGVGVEVIQFGSTTCGKPYGFYPQDNCGTTYFTTQFRSVNAAGFGDYPDGFSPVNSTESTVGVTLPGCQAVDDYTPLGETTEPMLAAALAYRQNGGVCSGASSQGTIRGVLSSLNQGSLIGPTGTLGGDMGGNMYIRPSDG
ncbi:MAG: PDZ domain-containing protein [OM182 bacterium]|nr:MAG: PDZ domain-containing protein [OM182 bacterium]